MSNKLGDKLFRNHKYSDLSESHRFDIKMAMTAEDLHSKDEIAQEICIRDQKIAEQAKRIEELEAALKPFASFACSEKQTCDCNNCTKLRLKMKNVINEQNGYKNDQEK